MKAFLHKYLRKWNPPANLYRQHAMPHLKTYACFHPQENNTVDWVILTSANLSKAAWGTYQKNQTQFMIRSYELGVLLLPTPPSSSLVVNEKLPLPYTFPLSTYQPSEDEPWIWDIVREDPDGYGDRYLP